VRRGTWRSWLPLVFIILAILLLALHETSVIAPIENALQVVLAPLQRSVSQLTRGVGDLFYSARDARELRLQVDELQSQVDTLSVENVRLREFEAEVVQLRSLLQFTALNPTWGVLGADVVGRAACLNAPCGEIISPDPNPYLRYLAINAGIEDGVAVGMPVVTGGAVLIGRIAEAGPHTSKVELLNDPGSGVAVFLQQSRANGLVVGQPDSSLRMVYISQEETVLEGDIILTSGLGGTLPRGLVVGQVASVQQQDLDLHQEAAVRPAVDYQRVEMVLVISSFQPLVQEEPTPTPQP